MTNEELLQKIRQGTDTKEATGQLYAQNIGIIRLTAYSIAGKFTDSKSRQIDLQRELEQEAYFGLLKAIEKWDPGQNIKFLSYALYWIRLFMLKYCKEMLPAVRLPQYKLEHLQRYRAITEQFEKLEGRRPTVREYCRELHIAPRMLETIQAAAAALYIESLDRPINSLDEQAGSIGDTIPAPIDTYGEIIDAMQREELAATIWPMVDSLPPEQSRMIRDIYQKRMTIKEAGEAAGMTQARAVKCKEDALRALRTGQNGETLAQYHDRICLTYGLKSGIGKWRARGFTSATEWTAIFLLEDPKTRAGQDSDQ